MDIVITNCQMPTGKNFHNDERKREHFYDQVICVVTKMIGNGADDRGNRIYKTGYTYYKVKDPVSMNDTMFYNTQLIKTRLKDIKESTGLNRRMILDKLVSGTKFYIGIYKRPKLDWDLLKDISVCCYELTVKENIKRVKGMKPIPGDDRPSRGDYTCSTTNYGSNPKDPTCKGFFDYWD